MLWRMHLKHYATSWQQPSKQIGLPKESRSQKWKSREHTPSGIQTGDETAWVVFSSTETVQSIITKRQPSFAVNSVSHHLVQITVHFQSTVHSPGFTISLQPVGSLMRGCKSHAETTSHVEDKRSNPTHIPKHTVTHEPVNEATLPQPHLLTCTAFHLEGTLWCPLPLPEQA